jgi:hypothetical protein
MPRKPARLPHIPTHTIHAAEKVGASTTAVMAVLQDGTIRLYDADEAHDGRMPAWRVACDTLPADEVARSPVRIQRNRKHVASAELTRTSDVLYYTIDERAGELVAVREPVVRVVSAVPTATVIQAVAADALGSTDAPGASASDVVVSDDDAADPDASSDDWTPVEPGGSEPTQADTIPTPTRHRDGSVLGMTVDELRAEFTAITGQEPSSTSLHYLRKLVMRARRGARDFPQRPRKSPTLTLTLAGVRGILNKDSEALNVLVNFANAHLGVP